MEIKDATEQLACLSHETRLRLFKELVKAERPNETGGLPAGDLAERMSIAPPTLSFHLKEMSRADLVTSRKAGRSIIYRANLSGMTALVNYLLEDCCGGACGISLTTRQGATT